MFSKKATKIDEIFTMDLTVCSKCQIDSEDFVNFRGFNMNFNPVIGLNMRNVWSWELWALDFLNVIYFSKSM